MQKLSHEFKQCVNIVREDADTNLVVERRNYLVRVNCLLEDITLVENYINKVAKISKTKCVLYHKDKGRMIIHGRYKEIIKLIFPPEERSQIGFKRNENNGTKRL